MAFNPNAQTDPFISLGLPHTLKESPVSRPRGASEYSEALRSTMSFPRSGLFAELMLVQSPRWMVGLWADVDGGWRDSRSGMFLSFADARALIDARTSELGLDTNLVKAYQRSSLADRGETAADEQAFWRTPFHERMNKFRVSQ